MTSVLLLAGTSEAAELARRLHTTPDVDVLASFAGRVESIGALPCAVRVGGFGGVAGLVEALRDGRFDALVDATHPFAAQMAAHAYEAATSLHLSHLRLLRPRWTPLEDDDWHEVADLGAAARWLDEHAIRTAFLATGRHDVAPFEGSTGTTFILRSIDPPGPIPLMDVEIVLGRGPFDVDTERALFERHAVEAVVARNSGGEGARAKLTAARQLGLPVVMVRRPISPRGTVVETPDEAMAWVRAQTSAP